MPMLIEYFENRPRYFPCQCMIYVKTSMPMLIEYFEIGHDIFRAKDSHF